MYLKNTAIFFDFDGVLVDSTKTKTNAYRDLFGQSHPAIVSDIMEHHRQHGGISRVEKIKYAFRHLIDAPYSEKQVAEYAQRYSELVFERVIRANWVPGAESFVHKYYQTIPLFIISGTPEDELLEVVQRRSMTPYFKEILGSPIQKPEHIRSLLKRYNLEADNCFFIGDALTDYYAAKETRVPFIGIYSEITFPEGTTVLSDCTNLAETMVQFRNT